MFDKLDSLELQYDELSARLCETASMTDSELFSKVMKELKTIEPTVLKYQEYKRIKRELDEVEEMISENDEDDIREMLFDEQKKAKEQLEVIENELKELMLPKDPDDDRNVIVEIRGGAGGEEAALFAAVLYRMYSMYAAKNGWSIEIINSNATELGGYKEIEFMIKGTGAYSKMKFESGVHRVQRVPETETQGRIHTSTVTVAVLPEAEEAEVEINPSDLKIDTYRSSGAGGQHINKTESAIRITHLPTGLVVECQDERSQYKNKDKAMKVLRSRLLAGERQRKHEERAEERRSQVGTGDRSERIRTYNYHQGRVTDHRIGLTLYKIDEILNGDMEEIVEALKIAEKQNKTEISEN